MANCFATFYYHIDGFLIYFYRLTGYTFVDYIIGTMILGFICVIVGELSVSLAIRANKRYLDSMSREMKEKEMLAIAAYGAGDKKGYKALNKAATDVWGKHFFTMVAYSAGILWPIPFALGWITAVGAVDNFRAPELNWNNISGSPDI